MRLRSISIGVIGLALALAAIGACGSGSTAPSDGGGGVTLPSGTHPLGTIYKTDSIGSDPYGVAVSSLGAVYVTQFGHFRIARLDSTGAETDSILVAGSPSDVTFSPDGRAAYDLDQAPRTINFISVPADSVVATLHYPSPNRPLRVLRRRAQVFVTTGDSHLQILDASNAHLDHQIPVGGVPNGLAFSPDGTTLFVANSADGTVSAVSLISNQVGSTFPVHALPQDLAVSLAGGKLFVANEGEGVTVWNTSSHQLIKAIDFPGDSGAFGLAMTPDGEQVWAASPTQGRVYIIDVAGDSIVGTVETGGIPRRLAFSADGTWGVITNERGWVDFVH